VREDLLGRARPDTPTVFDWKAMAAGGSMLNTHGTYSCTWRCGIPVDQAPGRPRRDGTAEPRQGERLYGAIDGSGFYKNPVARTAAPG